MKLTSLCLTALTALLASTTTFAQEPESSSEYTKGSPRIYEPADLTIHYHEMKSEDSQEAVRLVDKLYGRTVFVKTADGPPRRVRNLFELNDLIVIYDTAEEAQRIIKSLEEIDAVVQAELATHELEIDRQIREKAAREEEQNQRRGNSLASATYTPRFMGAVRLAEILQPYAREFQVYEADGSWHMTHNLRASDTASVLVIRDTEANVKMILNQISTIDRPLPQVMLSAYLLSPSGYIEGGDKSGVPEDLTKNLALLTPYKEFDRLSLSSIRTNVGSREETILRLNYPSGEYGLSLSGMTYDPKTRSLSVGSARLRKSREEGFDVALHTTFAAIEGEYAVIGISEENGTPLLLAITFKSIARPKVN